MLARWSLSQLLNSAKSSHRWLVKEQASLYSNIPILAKRKKKNTREWAIKPMNSQELVTTENIFKYPLIWACEMFPVRWRDKLLLCEHLWILDTIVHLRRLLWLIYQITFRAAYSVWSPQQETLLQQVHTHMQAARPIEPFFPVDARCVCSRNRYWCTSGQVL